MPRPSSKYPTELELEILKILWREGPLPVSSVRDHLTGFRELAHTSVMTIMNIMTEKKYLKRTRNGKSYTYKTVLTEEKTTRGMLGDIVNRAFDGSAKLAMLNLLEAKDIHEDELKELKRIIGVKVKEERKCR